MNIVERKDLPEDYEEMMATEAHHDHVIIKDEHGTLRWKKNERVEALAMKDLNTTVQLFMSLGHGKNSEIWRKMYREMGYSLSGYWEIFYWDMNNPDVDKYRPPMNGLKIIRDFCEKQNKTMQDSITEDKGDRYVAVTEFAMTRYEQVINLINALLKNEATV